MNTNEKIIKWVGEEKSKLEKYLNTIIEKQIQRNSHWTHFIKCNAEQIIRCEEMIDIFKQLQESIVEHGEDFALRILNNHSIWFRKAVQHCPSVNSRFDERVVNDARRDFLRDVEMMFPVDTQEMAILKKD